MKITAGMRLRRGGPRGELDRLDRVEYEVERVEDDRVHLVFLHGAARKRGATYHVAAWLLRDQLAAGKMVQLEAST